MERREGWSWIYKEGHTLVFSRICKTKTQQNHISLLSDIDTHGIEPYHLLEAMFLPTWKKPGPENKTTMQTVIELRTSWTQSILPSRYYLGHASLLYSLQQIFLFIKLVKKSNVHDQSVCYTNYLHNCFLWQDIKEKNILGSIPSTVKKIN
jgi:hypothetical protein